MSIPWSRFVTNESWPAGAVERLRRLRDMQHALEARASDYMMPDVMKTGGVTGGCRARRGSTKSAYPSECDGAAGTGVEWNEEAVSRYAA
jgi:L-alanine-DL-glutamate epimerase-like enolase superfamily enzyme